MLIRVTATVDTVVKVDDSLSSSEAFLEAQKIVRGDGFGIIRSDLEHVIDEKFEEVLLKYDVVTDIDCLPFGWSAYFPWTEDGTTTSATCGEILKKGS